MRELTYEQYQDRLKAINRAMAIFSELTNNDITKSFQLYQAIFAEREREIFLDTMALGNRPITVMDRYIRPQCPDCNGDMMFRQVPENAEGVKTQLVCQPCGIVLDSELTLDEWQKELKIKG